MWIAAWLGKIYSKLFLRFENELFTFKDALDYLRIDKKRLSVAFSKLHKERVLLVFDKGRPRQYRLIDPINFILLASDVIGNLRMVPQERYVKVLCDAFQVLSNYLKLTSLAVYGSVARGTAKENSDIDLLIVSNSFSGSIGRRIDMLCRLEEGIEELAWLRKHGIYTSFSFYPLTEEEALRKPLLFIDITEDAIILYDKDRFLERVLTELKVELLKIGAKRVFIDKDNWYWDLKPDYMFGEEIIV
ncbi:MAG: nucleotidyltransferase domain-containing protein [Crenarchaeota archaeon]|nr:nucleotidyltransferase domain-containing protein [Thermoproteota archaeon]MDW8033959.1 nucleotidyltransferase domain-containing protein [Nitrososphaerota archaeon]